MTASVLTSRGWFSLVLLGVGLQQPALTVIPTGISSSLTDSIRYGIDCHSDRLIIYENQCVYLHLESWVIENVQVSICDRIARAWYLP